MASGGHFHYRSIRGRALPGPLPVKWPPEATFTIDLFVDRLSLGHLLGSGFGSHFHYRSIRGRALPGPTLGKWPPEANFTDRFIRGRALPGPPPGKLRSEATFTIDLFVDRPSLEHLLRNGFRGPLSL